MRGGAREGSGRKKKYEELGQEGDTYAYRIPEEIDPKEVDDFVKEKLQEKRKKLFGVF